MVERNTVRSTRRQFLTATAAAAPLVASTGWSDAHAADRSSGAAVAGRARLMAARKAVVDALAERARIVPGTRSPNGWLVNTRVDAGADVWTRDLGRAGRLPVALGDAELVLRHVVLLFHAEVTALAPGDVVGFLPPPGLRGVERNHASGTAVDILPGRFPRGADDGLFPLELAAVHGIVEACEGVVGWGGDLAVPAQAHWQVDLPPGHPRLVAFAARLRARGA